MGGCCGYGEGSRMRNTGVFATKDELTELSKMAEEASRTPVIALTHDHAMRGGFAGDVWQDVKERCHTIALSHGLPEVTGFYGLSNDGEFLEA